MEGPVQRSDVATSRNLTTRITVCYMGRVVPMTTRVDISVALRPWDGEALTGMGYAVSGDRLLCMAPGGQRFEAPAYDEGLGRILTRTGITVYHITGEQERRCA